MFVTKNAKIQAYINEVCSQVKFREAHREIKLELETHFQELVEEYLLYGLTEDEAVDQAVVQMGAADTVGKQLHNVHKPRPEWSLMALSLLFVGSGLMAMFFIEKQGLFEPGHIPLFVRSMILAIAGAAAAVGFYFFNYRRLQPLSWHIYFGTVALLAIVSVWGQQFNGKPYFSIGPVSVDFVQISPILFGIALAGILNRWDWHGDKKKLQGFLICLLPLILISLSPSMTAGFIYSTACLTLLIVSGAKRRYSLLLAGIMYSLVIQPFFTSPVRLRKLFTFLNPESDPLGNGWQSLQLSKLLGNSGLLGHGIAHKPALLPALHTDFVFSYITYTFGWLAGGVLIALVALFIIRLTHIAAMVNDNYAKLLVTGIGTILGVQFLWNIAMNLGLAPISEIGLPFISYGGSQLFFNAVGLGIILSIYRRKNIPNILANN